GYYTTAYTTLANWQAANSNAFDQNSVSADPQFVAPATGNLLPSAAAINNVATPLTRVTDDITGAARSTTPDIGAYEFTPATNDVAVISLTSPVAPVLVGARSVSVLLRNNGLSPLTTVTVAYTLNGGTAVSQTFTGLSIASGATGTVTFTTQATLVAGANTIAVTATLPNGQADPTPANNTITTTVYTALTGGAYTINNQQPTGGTNFASFTAAAAALTNGGITGAATFTVLNGPYTEQFLLGEVVGTSATSRLTINGGGSTIKFGSSDSNQRAVVQLNGTDYTTINNLVIDAT
ncbi:choice-of-anchor Q domain-containing protein, partial [Hymenobacter daeguensis]